MNNTVFFEIQNRIAFITLNRPEVFNSFNRTMALALQEIIKDLNDNDDVRAITITGAGKAFSAGQDLAEAVEKDGPSFETILLFISSDYYFFYLFCFYFKTPLFCYPT